VKINTLYTCCEQVGRRGKDYDELSSNNFKIPVRNTKTTVI
jgi:hypothetical protein